MKAGFEVGKKVIKVEGTITSMQRYEDWALPSSYIQNLLIYTDTPAYISLPAF